MMQTIDKYEKLQFLNTFQPTKEYVKDLILKQDWKKMLDDGCGLGTLRKVGIVDGAYGIKLIGMDTFDKTNPLATYHSHLEDVPRDFDGILASHLLEHYWPHQVRLILKWYHEHLENYGSLIIVLPQNANPLFNFRRDSTHKIPYDDMPELYLWLEQAGFHIDHVMRSGIPDIKWYQKICRLAAGKLLGFNPFEDFLVVCHKHPREEP